MTFINRVIALRLTAATAQPTNVIFATFIYNLFIIKLYSLTFFIFIQELF